MASYHQMGHQSANLLEADELAQFKGAVLSPVNYAKEDMRAQIEGLSDRPGFETVFDTQLYVPNSERGNLPAWDYFPSDVDTADLTNEAWWNGITDAIAEVCTELEVGAICSPAVLPRVFADEYYGRLVKVGDTLCDKMAGTGIDAVQTAVVRLPELAVPERALAVASILSAGEASRMYLVMFSDSHPRREFCTANEVAGAMTLIAALEAADINVLVGFASSDVILWKAAGATSVATGKFFNLRRFTRARFEEPDEGGGQLPYWFEEALLAFLRQGDLLRYRGSYSLSEASLANPFGNQILEQFESATGKAWLSLSWRQFMYWFADIEARISEGAVDVGSLLKRAEDQWLRLDDEDFLMEERHNTGEWIRAWRIAVKQVSK